MFSSEIKSISSVIQLFIICFVILTLTSCDVGGGLNGKNDAVFGEDETTDPTINTDTIPPVLDLVTPVNTPTVDVTPALTFYSTEEGSITYSGACSSITTLAHIGNNLISFNTMANGTYSNCTIRVQDAANNLSTSLMVNTFTIDTTVIIDSTKPVLAAESLVTTPTNDTTPEYSFISSEAGNVTYSGSCSSGTTSAVVGSNFIIFDVLTDGVYNNCSIIVEDLSGNFSLPLLVNTFIINTAIVDVIKPTLVQVTKVTTPSTDTTPTYIFNSSEAGSITYGGACNSNSHSAVKGINTITFNNLAYGAYSNCTIEVTDQASNVSLTLLVNSFTILQPDVIKPILKIEIPIPTLTNDTTPALTISTTEVGVLNYSGSCTSGITSVDKGLNAITFNSLVDATYSNCFISETDLAGNVSELLIIPAFTIDSVKPVLTLVTPVPENSKNKKPQYTFSTTKAGVITYEGSCISLKTNAVVGHNTVTFATLNDDIYSNCSIQITDNLGNVSFPLEVNTFKIDTIKPVLTVVAPVSTLSNDTTPTYIFSSTEDGVIQYIGSCRSDTAQIFVGNNSITFTALTDATYSHCTIMVTDKAGNNSSAQPINSFTIDTVKPVLKEVNPVASPSNSETIDYTFSSTKVGTISYSGHCSSNILAAMAGNNTVTFITPEDAYTDCKITVTDALGNVSLPLVITPFIVKSNLPLISSIVPSSYLMSGKESKISGAELASATVSINGVTVIPTLQNAHEIIFVAPSLPVGDYSLQVDNGFGIASLSVFVRNPLHLKKIANGVHSCAVLNNGTVQCWGQNRFGELGDGTTTNSALPVTVVGINTAIAIGVGYGHSCVLLSSGKVQCWGENSNGQLGNNSIVSSKLPVTVSNISSAIAIAVGHYHNCAVLTNGSIQCWGSNSEGQLGNNTTQESHFPSTVNSISTAIDVSASLGHSCALLTSGLVECWGRNNSGELGNNSTISSTVPVPVTGINSVAALAVGGDQSCAILSNGDVKCWGYLSGLIPNDIADITNGTAVSVGQVHACALLSDNTIKCWGRNQYGELGSLSPTSGYQSQPLLVNNISGITDVSAGENTTCAILLDDSVQCWGKNDVGQLGNGVMTISQNPVTVSGITNVTAVSSSADVTCAIANTKVQCWGDNSGQLLVDDSLAESFVPVTVIDNSALAISTGWRHVCAVLTDGTATCWGDNSDGQLGNGLSGDGNTFFQKPKVVKNINNAIEISTGDLHSCALLSSGSVKCWGLNNVGQLGDGTHISSKTPVTVKGIYSAISVSTYSYQTCAVLSTGAVKCWGQNLSTQSANSNPEFVNGINDAIFISINDDHSCVVNSSGTVQCWGSNSRGQLGDNTTTDSLIPVTVSDINSAVKVSVNGIRSCALLEGGKVQCWGSDTFDYAGLSYNTAPVTMSGLKLGVLALNQGEKNICVVLDDGYLQCWGNLPFESFLNFSGPSTPVLDL